MYDNNRTDAKREEIEVYCCKVWHVIESFEGTLWHIKVISCKL